GYAEFTTLFTSLPEQATADHQSFEEALRLLYVGMTRARDYLIIPCKEYNKMAWLEKAIPGGLSEICGDEPVPNDVTISTLHKHYPSKFRFRRFVQADLMQGIVVEAAAPIIYTPQKRTIPVQDYFITPSSVEESPHAHISEYITLYPRMQAELGLTGDDGAFGTCIHAILCAYHPEMKEPEQLQLIERLLKNFGFTGIISPADLVTSIRLFTEWIGRRYKSAAYYKEYPMMVEKGNQIFSGIADLVIETTEEILLIDYKTFPGHYDPDKNHESCEWRARTYSGQMALYQEMLERVWPGRKVETVIWFVIAGALVKFDNH
ncbi:MAG: PD-(D/E)XK nuclease family protein, partial [Bacteroidetes bacterium]|nr:PD-(D/E)XK nuclease family protein [Bacteroidota bacterium]